MIFKREENSFLIKIVYIFICKIPVFLNQFLKFLKIFPVQNLCLEKKHTSKKRISYFIYEVLDICICIIYSIFYIQVLEKLVLMFQKEKKTRTKMRNQLWKVYC